MDPMSDFDIRLVFTLDPRDSTLQYKRCVHFPCLASSVRGFLCFNWEHDILKKSANKIIDTAKVMMIMK